MSANFLERFFTFGVSLRFIPDISFLYMHFDILSSIILMETTNITWTVLSGEKTQKALLKPKYKYSRRKQWKHQGPQDYLTQYSQVLETSRTTQLEHKRTDWTRQVYICQGPYTS